MLQTEERNLKLAKLADELNIENNLIHFLFLIGIHESGEGFKQFTKEEKVELIELGSTTLLAKHDYFIPIETESTVPFYVANPEKQLPETFEKEELLKNEIVKYLENKLNHHE